MYDQDSLMELKKKEERHSGEGCVIVSIPEFPRSLPPRACRRVNEINATAIKLTRLG